MEIFNGTTFFVSTEPTLSAEFPTNASLVGVGGQFISKTGDMLTGNLTFRICKAVISIN